MAGLDAAEEAALAVISLVKLGQMTFDLEKAHRVSPDEEWTNEIGSLCKYQYGRNPSEFRNLPGTRSWRPTYEAATAADEVAARITVAKRGVTVMSDAKADTMTPLFGMDNYSDVSAADTKDSGRSKRRTSVNNDTGVLLASSAAVDAQPNVQVIPMLGSTDNTMST